MQPSPGSPVGPDAVGARVVVRRRDADGAVGDVLGVLLSYDAERLVLRRRDGAEVVVPRVAVLAARVVPPQRVTARQVRALEDVAAQGWPGVEHGWIGEHGWLLRAGHGFTGRANSVLPLGDPGRSPAEAVEEVERWYGLRGLPARAQLPDRIGRPLDDVLAARGWPAYGRTVVLTAGIADGADGADGADRADGADGADRADGADGADGADRADLVDSAGDPARRRGSVRVEREPDERWLSAYRYRGGPPPRAFRDVLRAGEGLGFATLTGAGGEPAAIARASVASAVDGTRWVGVTAVEVAAAGRRQGRGRRLVAGLVDWAAAQGATRAYAQVAVDNAAGRAFWDALGFVEHHRYHYRVQDTRRS